MSNFRLDLGRGAFCPMLFVVFALLSGCASISRDGSQQTILVQTSPPGASLFVDGKKVGQSPEFVEVKRSFRPRIEVATEGGRRTIELSSKYRWSKSFFGNFGLFVIYAPLGWMIDLITGNAWDVKDNGPLPVVLSKEDIRNPKPPRATQDFVVAPPRSSSVAMSDEGGRALEQVLRNEAGRAANVRSYDKTLPQFIFHDYEYNSSDENSRRRLDKALRADVVYESSVTPNPAGGWLLKSEARDVYTALRNPGPTLKLDHDGEGPRVFGFGLGLKPWWSRILPDTMGVDFVNEQLNMELQGIVYSLDPVYGDEWWANGLRYISALNISSTPDRRRESGSRWEVSAVPSIRFSRKLLKASNLPPPTNGLFIEKDPHFERVAASAGYGLEVGYLFGRHYVYFDLIPLLNWSEISWRQSGRDRWATRVNILMMSELGYTYLFDSNWLIRLTTRSQAENTDLWRDAFEARLGSTYRPTTATGVMTGLTIGYRFDTDRYRIGETR